MLKIIIATLVLLIGASAHAVELPYPTDASKINMVFECGDIKLQPKDNDPDPIYKISITLGFDDDNTFSNVKIYHVSVSGEKYFRFEQYDIDVLKKNGDRQQIIWHGYWKKNRNIEMYGSFYKSSGQWHYGENQEKNGKRTSSMDSICHQVVIENN